MASTLYSEGARLFAKAGSWNDFKDVKVRIFRSDPRDMLKIEVSKGWSCKGSQPSQSIT